MESCGIGGSRQVSLRGRTINTHNTHNTMEINITTLLDLDCWQISHSRHEGGQEAGRNTWRAAIGQAEETPLLNTEEELQAMRDFARSSGGWDKEEIAAWSHTEVNALFLQWIAGDCRQLGADSLKDIDWEEARERQEQGQAPSNIFRADDGSLWFYLGN
jgi:hypothetical protein